ncbi:MAG: hypothetical protein WBD36_17150 [Bacteroidota bacterium]
MKTLKSSRAIVAGFLTVVVLSVGTDFVLEKYGIFPPQSEPAAYTWQLLLVALIYRSLYTVAGGYVTAWLAPEKHIRHAIILGIVGIIAGTIGAVTTWGFTHQHWYPVALVILALPCTWLGGALKKNGQAEV